MFEAEAARFSRWKGWLCAGGQSYRTGTAGIHAAGDLTYGGHQNTNTAIHMGNMAAAWMVFELSHDHREDAPEAEEAAPETEPVAADRYGAGRF